MEHEQQIREPGSLSDKRRIILTLALFVSCLFGPLVTGQVRFSSTVPDRKNKPALEVTVRDMQTKSPLAGADVVIVSGKDTLGQSADKHGRVIFSHSFAKDTIQAVISFLGYKPFNRKFYCRDGFNVLDVTLVEDPMEIDAIVVKDNHVSMISRGDTIVYNPAAFKIMKGDPLRELLKRMPGLEIRDGGLYSSGRKVQKILVNNTMLFGNNVSAAMDMIYGDEVVEVKSYDEIPQDLLVDADSLTTKERVLNIKTRTPREVAARITVLAVGGAFLDKEPEPIASADIDLRRFKLDKPDIEAFCVADENMSQGRPSSSPVSSVDGRFSIADSKKKKYSYKHSLNAGFGKSGNESLSKKKWYPTDDYFERIVESIHESEDKGVDFNYSGEHSFLLAGKTSMFLTASVYYKGSVAKSYDSELLLTDGIRQQTDLRDNQKDNTFGADVRLLLRHGFSKPRRSLSGEVRYVGMMSDGNGILRDTSLTSILPQYRVGAMSGTSNSVMFAMTYDEPLAKKLTLDFRCDLNTMFSDDRDIYTDRLTDMIDMLNSFNYRQNDFRGTMSLGIGYRDEDKLRFSAGVRTMGIWQDYHERIPYVYDVPVKYIHLSPYLNLDLTSYVRLAVRYAERPVVPTSRQLRRHLDTSNPLFLVSGNPDLKLPVARTAKMEFNATSFSISTSWKIVSEYEFVTNSIANKIVYFQSPEYIEEYDYTVLQGATLSKPVNVPVTERLNTMVSADISSSILKSTFSPYIGHTYTRNPFFENELMVNNIQHDFRSGLTYHSSFSERFSLSLNSGAMYSKIYHDGRNTYDRLRVSAGVFARWNIYKWLYWDGDFNYAFTKISARDSNVESIVLDMSLSARFGQGDRYQIGIGAGDLLNKLKSHNFYFNEQYMNEVHDRIFGRSLILSFKYTFDPSRR